MFRNAFNEPRPSNHLEIVEAFDELDLNPAECSAIITDNSEEEAPYNGWTAEITGEDSNGEFLDFGTIAYDSQVELRNDLRAAGLTDITLG